MAEIVRRPPIRAWLATAAALVLVIGLVIWGAREDRLEEAELSEGYAGPLTPEPRPRGTAGTVPSAAQDFLQFAGIAGEGERPQTGREHEYTAEGLRRLSAALESMGEARPGSVPQRTVEDIRATADRIQRDPAYATHAGAVRNAFIAAADAIASLDADGGAAVRDAARSIEPGEPLLEQQDEIRSSFRTSAEAIRRVSPNL